MRTLMILALIVVGCSGSTPSSDPITDSGTLVGPPGPTGPEGPAGPTGPQGPQGERGLQGDQGVAGSAGPAGAAGPAGSQGAQGPQGLAGPQGLPGAQGPKGDTGSAGAQGVKGDTGAAGPTGPAGGQGPTGPTGPQGPAGTPCDTTRLSNLEAAVASLTTRVEALEALESGMCPEGYSYYSNESPYVVCKRTLSCGSGCSWVDQVVKVGNFWIDRYEARNMTFGDGDAHGVGTAGIAGSAAGVVPQTNNLTWYQAAELCANAGKRLCTGSEWQTALSGSTAVTYPPTGNCNNPPSTTTCNVCATGTGLTGQATQCVTRFGAYDMLGNVEEWVADEGPSPTQQYTRGWYWAGALVQGTRPEAQIWTDVNTALTVGFRCCM